METIKIVHQIWSDKYQPLPAFCQELTKTWKENHSDWDYILWNEEMLDCFIKEEYPEYYRMYNEFTYIKNNETNTVILRFLVLCPDSNGTRCLFKRRSKHSERPYQPCRLCTGRIYV